MSGTKSIRTLALALLVGSWLPQLATAADARIHQWVDENGVVNFSQQKPRGVASTELGAPKKQAEPKPTSRWAAAKRPAKPEAAQPAPAPTKPAAPIAPPKPTEPAPPEPNAAAKAAYEADLAQAKEQRCADARNLVIRLQNSGRIRIRNAAGEEVAMSGEERARRMAEAQAMIQEHCS